MGIFIKKEVCPTCNGEKTIVCCSCGAEDNGECHTMVCPYCQGTGVMKSYNTQNMIIAVAVVVVAAVAALVLL